MYDLFFLLPDGYTFIYYNITMYAINEAWSILLHFKPTSANIHQYQFINPFII